MDDPVVESNKRGYLTFAAAGTGSERRGFEAGIIKK